MFRNSNQTQSDVPCFGLHNAASERMRTQKRRLVPNLPSASHRNGLVAHRKVVAPFPEDFSLLIGRRFTRPPAVATAAKGGHRYS
jgi:hypothetical protein